MTDWKGLEIKTLAQFDEWAKDATFTAISAGPTELGAPSVFERYAAQERAARAMWPTFRAAMLAEARRCWPDATITEIGDEIIVNLPSADGLALAPTCPECENAIDEPAACPFCGWAKTSR